MCVGIGEGMGVWSLWQGMCVSIWWSVLVGPPNTYHPMVHSPCYQWQQYLHVAGPWGATGPQHAEPPMACGSS